MERKEMSQRGEADCFPTLVSFPCTRIFPAHGSSQLSHGTSALADQSLGRVRRGAGIASPWHLGAAWAGSVSPGHDVLV